MNDDQIEKELRRALYGSMTEGKLAAEIECLHSVRTHNLWLQAMYEPYVVTRQARAVWVNAWKEIQG